MLWLGKELGFAVFDIGKAADLQVNLVELIDFPSFIDLTELPSAFYPQL